MKPRKAETSGSEKRSIPKHSVSRAVARPTATLGGLALIATLAAVPTGAGLQCAGDRDDSVPAVVGHLTVTDRIMPHLPIDLDAIREE